MVLAIDATGNAAVVAALIGVCGVITAAVLTAIYASRTSRQVGKPNGSPTLVQMAASALEEIGGVKNDVQRVETELQMMRGMVEAQGSDFRDHQREDRANFKQLFDEIRKSP